MAQETSTQGTNSETHNLQVAQVLADLNQLQLATVRLSPRIPSTKLTLQSQDQKAALSLLQINDTLDRRQSISKHILPTPENVFNSTLKNKPSASALQRLNTGSPATSSNDGKRPGVTPLLREQSSVSMQSRTSSTGSLGSVCFCYFTNPLLLFHSIPFTVLLYFHASTSFRSIYIYINAPSPSLVPLRSGSPPRPNPSNAPLNALLLPESSLINSNPTHQFLKSLSLSTP